MFYNFPYNYICFTIFHINTYVLQFFLIVAQKTNDFWPLWWSLNFVYSNHLAGPRKLEYKA